jgi:hypothetical protein
LALRLMLITVGMLDGISIFPDLCAAAAAIAQF